jgi:hypothetical protein
LYSFNLFKYFFFQQTYFKFIKKLITDFKKINMKKILILFLLMTFSLGQSQTAAPGDPGKNSWDVISLFSTAYTDVAGINFNPQWGQAASTAFGSLAHPNNLTTPSYGGDEVKQYQNSGNYQGTETAADVNVSNMTRFHIEIYSSTLTSIRVSLIKTTGGNVEVPTVLALTPNAWNVFNIDISGASFNAVRPIFRQIKYDLPVGASNIQNLIVDNIFFWRPATTQPPTFGTFTVPAKVVGDVPFEITQPTSNSLGSFTYTSSNTAVATISGSTITVVGSGTSTITATQAANGIYGTGSTTATLSVTPPAAPNPPARNTWDVISLYSNAYTTSSSASWGVVGTDVSISGNNTRLLSGSPTYRLPFTATNVSEMTTLHIDVYALNQASWQFRLNDKAVTKSTPVNGWTSIDILLSEYAPQSLNLTNVSFFDFFNPNGANPNTSYVDNIYFYKPASLPPPTLGSLTLPSPVSVGDAPFVLTNPTTNSTGTFSYTSSNTAVATVSGNTLTFVGGGTSVITCTVASDGVYGARSTSATLTVTFPLPGPSPIPPVRDPLSVVSLYTGTQPTYANVVNATQASWSTGSTTSNFNFTNGTNTCVQVNNLGFFGLVGASNFSVVGMTTMHVDIYVNTPMSTMILHLLAPTDRNYSIGPLATGWNSFDIPLTTYPGALNDIAGIKFEQSGGTPRQIYIDNVYFYKQDTWLGTTNSAWTTTSNWSSGAVPTATSDIIIATGTNQPVISSDVSISSLTIKSGATLTVNAGKKLTLSGNLTNNGTINFKSDVNGSAMFGVFNGTQSGTGVVTVERYIPAGKRAFRLLSPAVTTTNFISGNWQGQTHITGGLGTTGLGFDATETNNPSMFTYNNQVASSTGWTPITNTNATNLTAGVGYRMLVRGDRTPTNITAATTDNMNAAITLSATGTLKTGTVTLNASSTPAINNTANTTTLGYSLVGNPYQSAVDWNAVTKSGIDATYWAWDPNMGTTAQRGRYVAFNGTTNDNVDSEVEQFIQPGQAFFVKNTTSGTAGSLTFEEADKATTSANVFRTNNQTESTNFATLSMQLYDPNELAIGGYPIDATKAVFGSEYTNELGLGDATKLEAAGENIAWFRNNTKLAIDAAAPVTTSDELAMKTLRLVANKNYTFKIQTTNFDTALTPYLVDTFLNTQTEIATSQAYLATFATTSNVASYNENRFKIVFQNALLSTDTFASQVGLYPNPSKGNGFYLQLTATTQATVKLYNTLGQEIAISHNEGHYQAKQSLAAGVYHIMVTQGEKTSKLKWIVE